jgi:hypothetical protein
MARPPDGNMLCVADIPVWSGSGKLAKQSPANPRDLAKHVGLANLVAAIADSRAVGGGDINVPARLILLRVSRDTPRSTGCPELSRTIGRAGPAACDQPLGIGRPNRHQRRGRCE